MQEQWHSDVRALFGALQGEHKEGAAIPYTIFWGLVFGIGAGAAVYYLDATPWILLFPVGMVVLGSSIYWFGPHTVSITPDRIALKYPGTGRDEIVPSDAVTELNVLAGRQPRLYIQYGAKSTEFELTRHFRLLLRQVDRELLARLKLNYRW